MDKIYEWGFNVVKVIVIGAVGYLLGWGIRAKKAKEREKSLSRAGEKKTQTQEV